MLMSLAFAPPLVKMRLLELKRNPQFTSGVKLKWEDVINIHHGGFIDPQPRKLINKIREYMHE